MGVKAALQEGRQSNVGKMDDLVKSRGFGGKVGIDVSFKLSNKRRKGV